MSVNNLISPADSQQKNLQFSLSEVEDTSQENVSVSFVAERNYPKKRKTSTEGSVTPEKQVPKMSPQAGELKLHFTLTEEYIVSEIKEANGLITKMGYDEVEKFDRDLLVRSFQKTYDLYKDQSIIQIPQSDQKDLQFNQRVFRSVLNKYGKFMFESMRNKVPDGLPSVLAGENMASLNFIAWAQYFAMGKSGQIIAQLELSNSDTYINLMLEKFPDLESLPALKRENFVDFQSPYLQSSAEEEHFEKTMDTLCDWMGCDPQLSALCFLYLMASVSPNSKLAKNRNLKTLCKDIAHLMNRYLSSRKDYTDHQAAVAVHKFRGLVPDIRQCGGYLMENSLRFDSVDTSLENLL